MLKPYTALILLVALERLLELRLSATNARKSFAQGGIEYGQGHFLVMRLLHTAMLLGCLLEVSYFERAFVAPDGWLWLSLVLLAQGLRYWAVISLGQAWNVRVIVVPHSCASRRGPYRHMRHPNYVAVVLEGLALPLVHGAYLTAALFSLANLFLLRIRISCEEKALRSHLQNYL